MYIVRFDNNLVYIGSTCESLDLRLKWHLSEKNSLVFKYKNKNSHIKLIENVPSKDRKALEKVENGYIEEYPLKYGDKLLNKKNNPCKKIQPLQYKVSLENEEQLRKRVQELTGKLIIKDNQINSHFVIDAMINNKRCYSKARYINSSKDTAYKKISKQQQKFIEELTIFFD